MSYSPPLAGLSIDFSFQDAYSPPDPSLTSFAFGDEELPTILNIDNSDIVIDLPDHILDLPFEINSQNSNIKFYIDEASLTEYQSIQSADSIIKAIIENGLLELPQEINSADTELRIYAEDHLITTDSSGQYIFEFIKYYSKPDPDDVVFYFGSDPEEDVTRIVSYSSIVKVKIDDHTIEIWQNVESEDSAIKIDIEDHTIEVTIPVEFQSENSVIKTEIQEHEIEDYHGIQSDDSRIKAKSQGLDIDGGVTDHHNFTLIPEFVHDNSKIKIDDQEGQLGGGQYQNLPAGKSNYNAIWGRANIVAVKNLSSPFQQAQPANDYTEVCYGDVSYNINIDSDIAYTAKLYFQDQEIDVCWQNVEFFKGQNIESLFTNKLFFQDDDIKIPWGDFNIFADNIDSIPYLAPPAKDESIDILWGSFYNSDDVQSITYLQPDPNDRKHGTYWGAYWYSLLCTEKYFPPTVGNEVVFNFNEPYVIQDPIIFNFVKSNINNLKCPYDYPYSGPRQPYHPPIIPPDTLYTLRQGVYYIMNSTYIRRISGNMESIDFQSVDISIDQDSWLWSFNIKILSKTSFDLIKPQGSVFNDVEIYINGWKWSCRIESWTENIVFGKKTWTVTGKSPSVELGEPYSIIPTFENAEMHGGQIIDDILSTEGWGTEWDYDQSFDPHINWLIPASAINMSDTSTLKIIQNMMASVGGFIQTNADTNTLDVGEKKIFLKPKYKYDPWDLYEGYVVPEVSLVNDVCNEIGRSNKFMKPINAVIVSGENQGVIVNAVKSGTAGDVPAPMVINQAITTREAGIEKARHIIGNSGNWINHTMKLFSLMPPEEAPGLLLPRAIIEVNETGQSAWRGYITATSIFSGWGSNGLTTSQTIKVEEHLNE